MSVASFITDNIADRARKAKTRDFESFIKRLVSPSYVVQYDAKSNFDVYMRVDPNSLFERISSLLFADDLETRGAASIVLQSYLIDRREMWNRLNDKTKNLVEARLLNSVVIPDDDTLVQCLCSMIASLALTATSTHLNSTLIRWVTRTGCSKSQEIGFLILALMSPVNEHVLSTIKHLRYSFAMCLTNPGSSTPVKKAAVKALVKYLPHLSENNEFTDLLPSTMIMVIDTIVDGQESTARSVLEMLTDLTVTTPLCFERQRVMEEVISTCFMIGKSKAPDEETRYMAFTLVTSLVDSVRQRARVMFPLLQYHINAFIEILLEMLVDVTHVPTWSEEGDANSAIQVLAVDDPDGLWTYTEESKTFWLGKQILSQLATSLAINEQSPQRFDPPLVEYTYDLLGIYLQKDATWQQRHAAVVAMAILSGQFFIHSLERTLFFTWGLLFDENVRVRWVAITYLMKLYRMSNDIKLREIMHRNLTPYLMCLAYGSNLQLRARAREACFLFGVVDPDHF